MTSQKYQNKVDFSGEIKSSESVGIKAIKTSLTSMHKDKFSMSAHVYII